MISDSKLVGEENQEQIPTFVEGLKKALQFIKKIYLDNCSCAVNDAQSNTVSGKR